MAKRSSFAPMLIIATLFFIFGFVTWLNGSLIPFLKIICELSEFEVLFVSFAFYIAYTVMAFPMAFVLERTGYKKGMEVGLGVMAFASLLFIPAALSGEYLIFLVALFMLGTGLTLLQSASNPYVVFLGPIESAARRISIMGLINKAAGVVAPILFTALVFSGINTELAPELLDTKALAQQLIIPYVTMAGVLFILMFFVKFSSLPELLLSDGIEDPYDKRGLLEFPQLILGAAALFFYVGAEVIAGDTIGLYAQSLGLANATAFTAYTMAFMVLGYLIGIFFIPKYLSQEKALLYSSLFGVLFTLGILFSSQTQNTIATFLWGWSGVALLPDTIVFVALLGFANALVWPTIWPLALDGLKQHMQKASALLIMAIAGGALLPLVFGKIVSFGVSMQDAYLMLLVCYLFIALYAMKWHKKRSW